MHVELGHCHFYVQSVSSFSSAFTLVEMIHNYHQFCLPFLCFEVSSIWKMSVRKV